MEEVIAKFSQVSPQERTKRFGVFQILIDMFLFVPALFGLVFYSLVAFFFENRKFESLEVSFFHTIK